MKSPAPFRLTRGLPVVLAGAWLAGALFGKCRAAEDTNLPPVLAPPEFMRNKRPLPDMLLKDKRENRYLTGFPTIGWDPETAFNYGVALQIFNNGPKDSPFFRYTPYRQRFAVAVAGATGGYSRGAIGYDHPYIFDSPWRLRTALVYRDAQFANYFGYGEDTLDRLSYPGSPFTYKRYDDYVRDLEREINGQTWKRYDNYRHREGLGVLTFERDYLGGLLRPQLGFQFSYVDISDYTGDRVEGAIMQSTRLLNDYLQGNVLGVNGGWDNAVKVGLTYDSRDFEPDPYSVIMALVTGRFSTELLGSDFDYIQLTLSARGFYNLLPEPKRLILAGRLSYAMQFGDIPFFNGPRIPFTDGDTTGLGGYPTLRGYKADRFVGDARAWANLELRWSFAETMFLKQHLRFMLVPFVDAGRVFDSLGGTTLRDWKLAGGLGFRLAWNLATVISFDYSYSEESNFFNMELGHQF